MLTLLLPFIYLFLYLCCTIMSIDSNLKWWEAFFLSLFFNPWIAVICMYVTGSKEKAKARADAFKKLIELQEENNKILLQLTLNH
jgi:hypothetical protein